MSGGSASAQPVGLQHSSRLARLESGQRERATRRQNKALDGERESLPARALFGELLSTERRQTIVLRAAIVFGRAPIGLDPCPPFESMQGRIERALVDLQDIPGDLLDALRDPPSVHW